MWTDPLPAEPQGKPENTGVGSPSPAALPDPGIEPGSPALQADSLPTELSRKPRFPGWLQSHVSVFSHVILRAWFWSWQPGAAF